MPRRRLARSFVCVGIVAVQARMVPLFAVLVGLLVALVGTGAAGAASESTGSATTVASSVAGNGKILVVAWSPRSERGRLFVLNANGKRPRWLRTGKLSIQHARWSPDGRFVAYWAGDGVRNRRVIGLVRANGSGRRVVAVCPQDACEFAWAPTGKQLAVIERTQADPEAVSVSLVHRVTDRRVQLASCVGEQCLTGREPVTFGAVSPGLLAWSPNGERIAYVLRQDGQMRIIVSDRTGPNQISLTVPTEVEPNSLEELVWSADGAWLGFKHFQGRLRDRLSYDTIRPDGSQHRSLLRIFAPHRDVPLVRWSPNGQQIAVATAGLDRRDPPLALLDPASGKLKRIRRTPPPPEFRGGPTSRPLDTGLTWSPNSRRFALVDLFSLEELSRTTLATVAIDERSMEPLTELVSPKAIVPISAPVWSPDGRRILYISKRSIYMIPTNRETPQRTALLPRRWYAGQLDWHARPR